MRGGGGPGVGTPGRPRWGSGATTPRSLSTGSSPRGSDRSSDDGEELVEVTLDLLEDDNIVLRSVEPAAGAAAVAAPPRRHPDPTPSSSAAPSRSRSPTMRRTSSHRLLQFSHEHISCSVLLMCLRFFSICIYDHFNQGG